MNKPDPKVNDAYRTLSDVFNGMPHPIKPSEQMTELQLLAIPLVSKTMRTLRSTYELWKIGMAEDMGSLIRGILETYVVLRYLHEQGTKLDVDEFVAKAIVKQMEISHSVVRAYPDSVSANILRPKLPELRKRAKEAKNKYLNTLRKFDRWDWLHKRTPQWLQQRIPPLRRKRKSLSYEQMANKIGMGQEFSFVYPDLSGYVHPDAYSAGYYVKFVSNAWKVLLEEPDYDRANRLARVAIGYTLGILESYSKIHILTVPKSDLERVFEKIK